MVIKQIDENQNSGRVTMGLSVIMRVTLKDGTYHEVNIIAFVRIRSHYVRQLTASRISVMATSKTQRAKRRLSRSQRKKQQQTA